MEIGDPVIARLGNDYVFGDIADIGHDHFGRLWILVETYIGLFDVEPENITVIPKGVTRRR
jgi:hypothetical protein